MLWPRIDVKRKRMMFLIYFLRCSWSLFVLLRRLKKKGSNGSASAVCKAAEKGFSDAEPQNTTHSGICVPPVNGFVHAFDPTTMIMELINFMSTARRAIATVAQCGKVCRCERCEAHFPTC